MATDYTAKPTSCTGFTVVRCMSNQHGDVTHYIPHEDFHDALLPTIRDLWVNGYAFLIQEGE